MRHKRMTKEVAVRTKLTNTQLAPVEITPATILDRAVASGAGVDVVAVLMKLRQEDDAFHARKAYNAAIAAARAEIPVILKTNQKTGAGGSYAYETHADIAAVVDPILAKHGLSYRYRSESGGGNVTVTCVISHEEGHSESNSLTAGLDNTGSKNPVQALGSTTMYLMRYTLKLALGIATAKDDDGAGGHAGRPPRPLAPAQAEVLRPYQNVDGDVIDSETGEITEAEAVDMKAPGFLVSPSQRNELIRIADDLGVDKAAFCKYFNIASLADVPAAAFDKAKTAMLAAKKKRAG